MTIMRAGAYYNDSDDYCCEWLVNLIREGHIAPGDVDNRSIEDIEASDLAGYAQHHFFAGIGVWSYALRQAGWPDDRPVWTGSCPCQPFSGAGMRGGFADERHLWPVWFNLIRQCRPGIILGEQVASKDGLEWWDAVSNNLESETYAAAALDLCVPGVGGPHIRQRLYWLADTDHARSQGRGERGNGSGERAVGASGLAGGLAREGAGSGKEKGRRAFYQPTRRGDSRRMGNTEGQSGRLSDRPERLANSQSVGTSETRGPDPLNGFWADADWLLCRDGKWRPVEPGTFPLAHGTPARVGRLCAYGNAICAPLAVEFIKTIMEII